MANPEHLEILKQGVETWNQWRAGHPTEQPDLSGAQLSGAQFSGVNFSNTKLINVNFTNATLKRANFRRAELKAADLSHTNLEETDFCGANLLSAHLVQASLFRADLRGAQLTLCNLSGSILIGANLNGAKIFGTNFTRVALGLSDFTNAESHSTVFSQNDLSDVLGLDTINHAGPSDVGINTIYQSGGRISEAFLRGCGIPESFIMQLPTLMTSIEPIQFYSCFISYSSRDQEFAERIHVDLQAKGVRVWFAPHDLPIGARIRPTIDESIRVYDKLLLVLSEASVSSQWVEQEVETALAKEREQEGKTILFPIRIDDAVLKSRAGWPSLLRNTRNVGDFTRWKEHDSYTQAFERLLRDLKAEV